MVAATNHGRECFNERIRLKGFEDEETRGSKSIGSIFRSYRSSADLQVS